MQKQILGALHAQLRLIFGGTGAVSLFKKTREICGVIAQLFRDRVHVKLFSIVVLEIIVQILKAGLRRDAGCRCVGRRGPFELLQGCMKSKQRLVHLLCRDRFEQILECLALNGLFRIFKVGITTDKHNLRIGMVLTDILHKLDASHDRHLDIGENSVRLLTVDQIPHHIAGLGGSDYLEAKVRIMNLPNDTVELQDLILRDHDSVFSFPHIRPPSLRQVSFDRTEQSSRPPAGCRNQIRCRLRRTASSANKR